MKNSLGILVLGFFLGAISWGIVALVSNRFEPFDSLQGFLFGQLVLSAPAFWIGYRLKIRELLIFVVGAYSGMNSYAYVFGTSDQRAWFILGLVTTLSLIVIPLIGGLLGRLVNAALLKSNRRQ